MSVSPCLLNALSIVFLIGISAFLCVIFYKVVRNKKDCISQVNEESKEIV
ncbi:hypothetical protein AGMMS50229_06940 [Campylobacterota bacterium]|nr:hypothetical protein AGMMS50229_06940 [Campylobacterota bacterium]